MIKFILWLVRLVVLVFIVAWLMTQEGAVSIRWNDYLVDTSLPTFVGIILLVFVAIYLVIRFWSFIVNLPANMQKRSEMKRLNRGLSTLLKVEEALALEDKSRLRRMIADIQHSFGDTPVTHAILARIGLKTDDNTLAETHLRKLSDEEKGTDLARIWMAKREMDLENWDEAYKLLIKLVADHPSSVWGYVALLDVCQQQERYEEALDILPKLQRLKVISRIEMAARQSQLYYNISHNHREIEPSLSDRIAYLKKAHSLDAGNIKASLQLAKIYRVQNKDSKASKVIEETWPHSPNHDLADLYASIAHATNGSSQLQAIEKLCETNSQNPTSLLIKAKYAIKAKQWGKARAALTDYQEQWPLSVMGCQLMAMLEMEEHGNEAQYRHWLERAVTAPADSEI
jgi:HemY protein